VDAAAVLTVADEGGFPAGELDTDLVGASGLRVHEQAGDGGTVEVEGTGGFVGEDGFLCAFPGMFCIDDVCFIVVTVEEEHIAEFACGGQGRVGGDEGGIGFVKRSVGDNFRQFGGGFFCSRVDHETGGGTVEAVDGIEFIGVRFPGAAEGFGDGGGALAFGEHSAGFVYHDKVAGGMDDIDHGWCQLRYLFFLLGMGKGYIYYITYWEKLQGGNVGGKTSAEVF